MFLKILLKYLSRLYVSSSFLDMFAIYIVYPVQNPAICYSLDTLISYGYLLSWFPVFTEHLTVSFPFPCLYFLSPCFCNLLSSVYSPPCTVCTPPYVRKLLLKGSKLEVFVAEFFYTIQACMGRWLRNWKINLIFLRFWALYFLVTSKTKSWFTLLLYCFFF